MPSISNEIQNTLWKIGDALAQALSDMDPSWRVTGLGSKAWQVSHPELPVVKDDQGAKKDILLQMHLQEDEDAERWFVIAQNKVVSPDSHSSPRVFIVADEDTPPSDEWPIEQISQSASNFFNKQHELLVQEAQAAAPQVPFNSGPPAAAPPGGPPGLGPMAKRRSKIAQAIVACPPKTADDSEGSEGYDESGRDNERDTPGNHKEDHIVEWLGHEAGGKKSSRRSQIASKIASQTQR